MGKFIDLSGQIFGRLTVIKWAGRDKNNLTLWMCKCACGNTIITRSQDLRRGASQSCGCLKLEQLDERSRKHSMAGTRPYRIWKSMKTRCLNPRVKSYSDYGGRGIQICDTWKHSFTAFWSDVKTGYADDLELDRIDHGGPYCPENCRWVDKKTQNRNTRANHFIDTPYGRITIAELSEKLGVSYDTLKRRVYKAESSGGQYNAIYIR